MKIQNISRRALFACVILIVACFIAFFTVGYNNPVGDYNEPQLTELLLWLMYGLTVVTAILTVWGVVRGIQSTRGNDPAVTTGVPGGKIVVVTIVLLIASLVVGYVMGMNATEFTAADGTVTAANMVTVTEMFLWSIYILTIAAVAAVGVSMSGILTKNASK